MHWYGCWIVLQQRVELLEMSLLPSNGSGHSSFSIHVGVGIQSAETLLLQLMLKLKHGFSRAPGLHQRSKTTAHPNILTMFL